MAKAVLQQGRPGRGLRKTTPWREMPMKMRGMAAALLLTLILPLSGCGGDPAPTATPEIHIPEDVIVGPRHTPEPTPEPAGEPVYGSPSGNLSNGTLAVQSGGDLYYLRPQPGGVMAMGDLIREDARGETAVVYSGLRLNNLNAVDGWIYYNTQPDMEIYRMRTDGTEAEPIIPQEAGALPNPGVIEIMVVVDSDIYLLARQADYTKGIYRLAVDGSQLELLSKLDTQASGFAVYDGWIYFSCRNESDAWEIWRIRTDGTERTKLADDQLYRPCILDGRLYYLTAQGEQLMLCGMDLDGSNRSLVGDGIPAVTFSGADGWLYYTDTTQVCRVRPDGTEGTKLWDFPSSNFVTLNLAGGRVFLMDNWTELYWGEPSGELQAVER